MSTTTRSQRFSHARQPRHRARFVLGSADDVDRRHLLERGDEVLADDRAVLDDERFQLAHGAGLAGGAGRAPGEHRRNSRGRKEGDGRARLSDTDSASVRDARPRRRTAKLASSRRTFSYRSFGVSSCSSLVLRRRTRRNGGRRAAALVVGSKRFTESYVLGEILTQTLGGSGRRGDAQAGPRQHRHPRAGARQRRGRSLPRVHRNDRPRVAQARRQSVARRAEPTARAARAQGCGSPRLQQHLCAGDDAAKARALGISRISDLFGADRRAHFGLSHEFLQRADGWPALSRPTALPPHADRARPRPRLRRGRRRPGRRDRRLLDRCQARPARPDGARGRPRLLPEVRRRRPDARRASTRRRWRSSPARSMWRP